MVFVPFTADMPSGGPRDVLTGFLDAEGKAMGAARGPCWWRMMWATPCGALCRMAGHHEPSCNRARPPICRAQAFNARRIAACFDDEPGAASAARRWSDVHTARIRGETYGEPEPQVGSAANCGAESYNKAGPAMKQAEPPLAKPHTSGTKSPKAVGKGRKSR